MTAIASTEHGLSRGAVAKKLECDKAGIKFIHGVEIYLTRSIEEKIKDNYHTILLAKNEDGRKELNRLMKLSSDTEHFYYTNRITFDEFVNLSDNIIKTSACLASPLNKLDENDEWFERLLMAYDFLEIQPHKDEEQIAFNKKLWELSKSFDIPLIMGTDTHSSTPYKAECRNIMLKQKGQSYGNEDHFDLSFKTYDELCEMMRVQDSLPSYVWEEAIDNTNVVARWCNSYELDTSIKYPILYGSPEEDERVFTERVWESLDDKVNSGIIPKEQEEAFRTAAQEELDVFHKIGMNGFMLSMSELIRWCKAQGMAIGTARGSVGGSRCAYLTDIIDLNPEQWHTVFSRFANEDRREIGDIDIDMIDEDRPKVFEYITNRFGDRKTARVAAYGTFQELNTIEAIVRGLGKDDDHQYYNLQLSDRIKKEFKIDPEATREKYKDIFYYFDGIVGVFSSQSVHPAGMVISPVNLDEEYGTFEKDGEQCLLLDMEDAHEVGLAKYDFLILRNVQIIRDTCRYAGIPYPQTYQIDFNDENVWKDMLTSPYGIFQMEGDYAFQSLKKFNTKSIFDMSLVTACIRPSGASYRDDLLAHKVHHNPSPIIDELLKDNLNYLIYQEDTIKFLQQICGLSGSEADTVRRGIGRKKKEVLDEAMPRILDGYCNKSQQPREVAEKEAKEFLQIIEDSASYQFGYNHSIAYCILGYFCAYMRYYYPIEFCTSLLNNAANDEDIVNGTALAKQKGFTVVNPKFGLTKSGYFYDKETKTIAKGLSSIKYMSEQCADELYDLAQNNYETFIDLLKDISDKTSTNARQLDLLIKIDYFSDFGNQRELLRINDEFTKLKKGEAKQISCSLIDGTALSAIIQKYASNKTKTGIGKNYKFFDCIGYLREVEHLIREAHLEDLDLKTKCANFADIMGYPGYITGDNKDRPVLYVMDKFIAKRKKDGKQFGYNIKTKSVGSGIESTFTIFNRDYIYPVEVGDLIVCTGYERNGKYFNMTRYKPYVG